MTTKTSTLMLVLSLFLWIGCDAEPETSAPPPEPQAALQPTPPEPAAEPAAAPPVDTTPELKVAKEDVDKAAGLYKVLHDESLDKTKKLASVAALMEANGWTEEAYQALLYDITSDPASRAYYLESLSK